MKPNLHIHPSMRFSCTMCGKCCKNWSITFTEAEKLALEQTNWVEIFPDLVGRTLWEPVKGPRGREWRFKLQENDACPFLGSQNECRIHGRFGPHAKPLTCQMFPFSFANTPEGVFAGLRFNCPGVLKSGGTPVSDDPKELVHLWKELLKQSAPPNYESRVRIGGKGRLEWADVLVIEGAFQRVLGDATLPFAKRVLVLLRIVETLEGAKMESLTGTRLTQLLDLVVPDFLKEESARPIERPRVKLAEWSLFHQYLGILYLREYISYFHKPRVERLKIRFRAYGNGFRFLVQRGVMPMTGLPKPVSLRDVWAQPGLPDDAECTELLERFFVWKLFAKATFSRLFFNLPYAHGVCFLAMSYGAIVWYAKASALSRGAAKVEVEDLRKAIEYVDVTLSGARKLSFYHLLVMRSLSRPGVAAKLVRWFAASAPPL